MRTSRSFSITDIYGRTREKLSRFLGTTHVARMVKNTGWLGAAMLVTMAAGMAKSGLLARLLGIEGLGIYGLIISTTAMFSLIFGFTSAEAAITFTSKYIENGRISKASQIVRYCLWLDLSISLLTFFAVMIGSNFFSNFFHLSEDSNRILVIYGLIVICDAPYWVSVSLLHLCDRFNYDFYIKIMRSLLSLAVIGTIYIYCGGLLAVVIAEVVISGMVSVIMLILALRSLHSKGVYLRKAEKGPWWRVPAEVWRFQIHSYFRASLKGAHRHLGALVLGYLTTPSEVGLYHAARRITDPIRNISGIFLQSLFPIYGKLWFSEKHAELKILFKKSALIFSLLAIGLIIAIAPIMRFIMLKVFGAPFIGSVAPALILLVCAALLILTAPLNALLPACGESRVPMLAAACMLVTQIICLYVLVPRYGSSGAALSFLIMLLAGNAVTVPKVISFIKREKTTNS